MAAAADSKTDNGAESFSTTGNAQLDLFFNGFIRGADATALTKMVADAWRESPEHTLEMILHARDCRGGKGERLVAYEALLWLRMHKPLSYKANLRAFISHGFYKDLLQLAKRAHTDQMPKLGDSGELFELELFAEALRADLALLDKQEQEAAEAQGASDGEEDNGEAPMDVDEGAGSPAAASSAASSSGDSASAAPPPVKRRRVGAKAVSLSLAAKWAPSAHSHFDRPENGQLGKRLRKLLFDEPSPADEGKAVRKVGAAQYRRMLSRLRAHIQLVEHKICAGKWDEIDYSKVPSRASMLYRKVFTKHDEKRYGEFIAEVKTGTKTIHAKTLHPHELSGRLLKSADDTLEVQWDSLVADLAKECTLQGTLAIVDVSGSMSGTPMDAALALGLMTAQVNAAPWKDKFITFSGSPEWADVSSFATVHEKLRYAISTNWAMNTDLEKVFELILTAAKEFSVPQADMPKRLVILSDMQFDQCVTGGHTAFQDMQSKYKAAGYEVPLVVFWNLRAAVSSNAFPVRLDQEGVSLVSGFSPTMLKAFVKNEVANPMATMLEIIEKYADQIQVIPSEA